MHGKTFFSAQYDWTTKIPDNGNEWRKFLVILARPLRPILRALSNRVETEGHCIDPTSGGWGSSHCTVEPLPGHIRRQCLEQGNICQNHPCGNHPFANGGKFFYLQLELFCLQLSFFAYSPLRPLLDALSHCKQKAPTVSRKLKLWAKKLRLWGGYCGL